MAALTPLGLDALNPDPEIIRSSSAAERAKAAAEGHKGFEEVNAALPNELPGDDSVGVIGDHRRGQPDGNEIQLHITRPHGLAGPLPCVIYVHGGWMVILNTLTRCIASGATTSRTPGWWSSPSISVTPTPPTVQTRSLRVSTTAPVPCSESTPIAANLAS